MADPIHHLPDDDASLDLPASFKTKLRNAHQPLPPTPVQWARVDDTVARQAALHFAKNRNRFYISPLNRFAARLGLYAALAFIAFIIATDNHQSNRNQVNSPHPSPSLTHQPLTGDVNGDGRLDILDAYLLQRRIETASTLESAWDLTRDDKVDAQDVSAIAAQSVKLQGGPRL